MVSPRYLGSFRKVLPDISFSQRKRGLLSTASVEAKIAASNATRLAMRISTPAEKIARKSRNQNFRFSLPGTMESTVRKDFSKDGVEEDITYIFLKKAGAQTNRSVPGAERP